MVATGSRITGYSAMFIDQIVGSLTSPDGGGTNMRYPQTEEIYFHLSPGVYIQYISISSICQSLIFHIPTSGT